MNKYAFAATLLLAFGTQTEAQPPVLGGAQPPIVRPPYESPPKLPPPVLIQVPSGKPAVGFYKTGNILVGADGYYPFDTGDYLLGGFEGLTRQRGTFVMMPPDSIASPAGTGFTVEAQVLPGPYVAPRHRLFHRR